MKKIISIFVCLLICFSLIGCGDEKADSNATFNNEEEMLAHLTGVWSQNDSDCYFVFSEGKIFKLDWSVNKEIESYFLATIKRDPERFENLTKDDCVSFLQNNIQRFRAINYTYDYEAGEIVFDKGKSYASKIIVYDDRLVYHLDKSINSYNKISNDTTPLAEIFGQFYLAAKEDYVIPINALILGTEELSAKIKESNPEINSYILIDETNTSKLYTDNGRTNDNSGTFAVMDDSVIFSKTKWSNKYVYSYSNLSDGDHVVVIQDNINLKTLDQAISEAILFVSRCPNALTSEELLDKYKTEGKIKSGARQYEDTIDGIKYFVWVSVSNGNKVIRISVE